jgi:hypothetical protein
MKMCVVAKGRYLILCWYKFYKDCPKPISISEGDKNSAIAADCG